MERLSFDASAFEKGAGRMYEKLIRFTLPALILGALQIGLINSGLLYSFETIPTWAGVLFMGVTIVYIIPGIFILPTVWFLRSGKTRKLRESFVLVGNRSVEYHQATNVTAAEIDMSTYSVTQIKKIEETGDKLILFGKVTEKETGSHYHQLEIPKAFSDMDKIQQVARYR
ncbi:MAG: hypothetical protein Q4F25_02615 [Eubacteriales bacterium]|nr:hypothetical protein [Eubacteriales bacterium]